MNSLEGWNKCDRKPDVWSKIFRIRIILFNLFQRNIHRKGILRNILKTTNFNDSDEHLKCLFIGNATKKQSDLKRNVCFRF